MTSVDFGLGIASNLVTDLLEWGGKRFLDSTRLGAKLKLEVGALNSTLEDQIKTVLLEAYELYFSRYPERKFKAFYEFFSSDEVSKPLFDYIFDFEPIEYNAINKRLESKIERDYILKRILKKKSDSVNQLIEDFLVCYFERERAAVGFSSWIVIREIHESERRILSAIEAQTNIEGINLPLLDSIPKLRGFIGRENERRYYLRKLQRDGVAIIEGMPGVGKTSMGAKVAHSVRLREKLWMTFRRGLNDNIDSVFWILGTFLSLKNSDDRLIKILELELTTGKPYSYSIKSNLLLNSLNKFRCLICFDDFHVIHDNVTLISLFQEMLSSVHDEHGRYTRILMMTREHPTEIISSRKHPLVGLSLSDAKLLLESSEIYLEDKIFSNLYKRTQGNPQFLRAFQYLFISKSEDSSDYLQYISQGSPNQEIWDFLISNVYQSLLENERIILSSLSIMRIPVSSDLINSISGSWDSSLVLRKLSMRFLVEEPDNALFTLHPLVKDFFYDVTDVQLRKTFHNRAALNYESNRDYLEAVYHYIRAEKQSIAIQLLSNSFPEIINKGQSGAISKLFQMLDPAQLSPRDNLAIYKLKGEIEILHGKFRDSINIFNLILENPSATDNEKASAWRSLGNAQGYLGMYDEAINSFEKSIEILGERECFDFSLVKIDKGYILSRQRHYTEAKISIEQGLKVLRKFQGFQIELSRGLRNLGDVYYELGIWANAINLYNEAMVVSRLVNDLNGMGRCYDDLGNLYYHLGDWQKSISYHEKAIEILERIGDLRGIAIAYSNLGNVIFLTGEWEASLQSHRYSLSIEEESGNLLGISICFNNVGNIFRSRGDYQIALEHYLRSLDITIQLNDIRGQAWTFGYLGTIYHEMGDLPKALDYYQRGYECAENVKTKLGIALAHLNLVRLFIDMKELKKAQNNLDQAQIYLNELNAKFEIG